MPEEMAVRVAEAAEVIVNGYALMKHDLGVRIVKENYMEMYAAWAKRSENGFFIGETI